MWAKLQRTVQAEMVDIHPWISIISECKVLLRELLRTQFSIGNMACILVVENDNSRQHREKQTFYIFPFFPVGGSKRLVCP